MQWTPARALTATMFGLSASLLLFELALTRVFGVVLFASFAHLALSLAMLGISLGAVVQQLRPQWMPEEGLERRLGWVSLAQGLACALGAVCALRFPVVGQFAEPPGDFAERSQVAWELVSGPWLAALMVPLTLPFAFAGLAFAAAFHRRRERIGALYGADLIGGALGALAFIPLLERLSAPDLAFVSMAIASASALGLFAATSARPGVVVSGVSLIAALGLSAAATQGDVLKVVYAAGYSEENVTWVRWTPLTRIAIHEDARGTYALLDNTSASQVVRTLDERERLTREVNRALVYRLKSPPGKVAILAASAGPEVAVAQRYGFTDIDAIDIAAIGDAVYELFPDDRANPYRQEGTRRVVADGRSAILHAPGQYDIIQMVHANLHSSAGLMSNAWSPSLLESKEAFGTYLDHLSPDGVLSFGRGARTKEIARAAAEALRERGAKRASDHILLIKGEATVMLVRKSPWTVEQRDAVRSILAAHYPKQAIWLDPIDRNRGRIQETLAEGVIITDDRPYTEGREEAWEALKLGFKRALGQGEGEVEPMAVVYHALAVQALMTLAFGLVLLGAPLVLSREPLPGPRADRAATLLYVAGLGYGYLAIEIALIHELALFVGHPTYAVTTVLLTMLLSSGVGSVLAGRLPEARRAPALQLALIVILILGAVQAWVVPELLHETSLGRPLDERVALVALALTPLGLVMGVPWSLGMSLLRAEAGAIVPWAWALNGWMSVIAGLGTVFASRLVGYDLAFGVALGAYAVSALTAHRLPRLGAP